MGAVPATCGTAPTTQDAPPAGSGPSVHDEAAPRNGVVALPVNVTCPVGGADDAVSVTVALQVVVAAGATMAGVHATVVAVGSMPASTAIPSGPPLSVMNEGCAAAR